MKELPRNQANELAQKNSCLGKQGRTLYQTKDYLKSNVRILTNTTSALKDFQVDSITCFPDKKGPSSKMAQTHVSF
jgi:hypothetical protein